MSHYQARKKQLENQFNITSYKDFVWDNDEDGDAIELAFSNMKIEERKHWLQAPPKDLDLKEKSIPYRDFMNKEFKQYAMGDLQRSIPLMVDGLKPRERKILFYPLKKPIIQKIELIEFSIYVLNHSPYHDGEVTLVDTIIGMAQNYVGINNINLLEPKRDFGTRWMGGKDHADVTLLFTRISPITRYLFHKDDELLLRNYLNKDGQSIEPASFIPIIPMVLVNGSEARGAWSSFIPNYNPRDIIANLIRLLEGKAMLAMLPWSWTLDYYEFLEAASRGGKDIKYYEACNDDDTRVHFEITMTKDQMNKARQEEGELWNKLKLTTTLSTANMYVLDGEGKLKKYDTPEELLEDFYRFCLHLYEKRKTSLPHELKIALMQNKSKEREAREETPPKEEDEDVAVKGYDGYNYLISQLDDIFEPEYIEELEEERKATDTKLQHLTAATPESLWLADLAALDAQLALKNYPEAKYTEEEKKARAKRA
ncbi:DNA topoisomerase 2 [Tanacetum coccineum]